MSKSLPQPFDWQPESEAEYAAFAQIDEPPYCAVCDEDGHPTTDHPICAGCLGAGYVDENGNATRPTGWRSDEYECAFCGGVGRYDPEAEDV